jgi:hypothetical protein
VISDVENGRATCKNMSSLKELGVTLTWQPARKTEAPLRQARIRESSGFLENIWVNIVFQIEQSSLSLSHLFNCRCVWSLSTP